MGFGPLVGGIGGDPLVVTVVPPVDPNVSDVNPGTVGDQADWDPENPAAEIPDGIANPDGMGFWFIWQTDTDDLDIPVTITIEDIGFLPYSLAFHYEGIWYTVFPLEWTGFTTTFTPNDYINGKISGKNGKAPVEIPIVFQKNDNPDDVLPVTLTSFLVNQAQNYGEYATIAWTVQSESNMLHYNLYRSESDLDSAIKIATKNAQNLSEVYTYSHDDEYEIAYDTTYYYWLEGVEVNGVSEIMVSGEVYIEADPDVPSLVTKLAGNYPNPFNPVTNIKYMVKQGETATLQIYNAKGQLVQTTTLPETTEEGDVYRFEGSKYGSGIYFYRLKTDTYSEVKKMIMLK